LWGTAFYAGLRLGELRALRWKNVDLASGVIRVEEALDHKGETIAPKSRSGRRIVPIVGALRELLLDLKLESASNYVFGKAEQPFSPSSVYLRARRAWRKAGLEGIGLHEARHTCASVMIAAGVNAKAITHYLGHSSIEVTFDRYGHLMPGNEAEAVALIDASGASEYARPPRGARPAFLRRTLRRQRVAASGNLVRQSCASEHQDQWTFTDFGGLNNSTEYEVETGMVERRGGGGGIRTLDGPNDP
jgi:hypothetical protein